MGLKPGQFTHNKPEQSQRAATKHSSEPERRRFLYCTACHAPITRQTDRISINEQHEHVFANPHGYIYHIGCFAQAPGCVRAGEVADFFSWFPGYAWQIALCGRCLAFLGWAFHSSQSQFWGLILEKLIAGEEKIS
ncbi:MAG: cereblon family protein [Candidatus Vecturithrix sp.]|jgi:hypothetical protein|nr:cereblon family protein [Candidatus Vecturithrix sp.]